MIVRVSARLLVVLSLLVTASVFGQESDLLITKSGPSTATADSDVTYHVTVTNLGPDASDVATLQDNTPANTTFVSVSPNDASCTTPAAGSTGMITCTNPTLAAGATWEYDFTFHIDPGTPAGTFITNVASVSCVTDPNSENDTASATTEIPSNAADVSVAKDGPASAGPNTDVTYTIVVRNNGAATATNISLTDTLPGNMTFVSITPGAGFTCPTTPAVGSGGTVICTAASMLNGAVATFSLTGHIPLAASAFYLNKATITSDNDPTSENDEGSAGTSVSSVDLAITKSGPATATADQDISYTITITNNGPNSADNAHFTDMLPPQATFVSLTQDSGPPAVCSPPAFPAQGGGAANCTFSVPLPNTASGQFTLVVHIMGSASGVITNSVTAASDSFDTNSGNDTATANTTVTGIADLGVNKSGPTSSAPGADISYTITVTNSTGGAAANAQLTDSLPPTTTLASFNQTAGPTASCSTPAPGANGTITCTWASLATNTTSIFALTIHTPANGSGSVSNTATVSTTTTDPNGTNDNSTATTTLVASSDVGVTKSGPASAVQNQDVTYNISVTNNGPSDATGVQLTDTIPAQATFVSFNQNSGPGFSCTTPAGGGSGTVTCNIATLAAGATATFTLVVHTTASVSGGMLNTANVSSTSSDPNNANNSASAATNIVTADISVTKNGSPATVAAGSPITYTIVVTNNGPANATNVTMSDTLPPNTTFNSLNQSGPAFICTTPAAGGTGTVNCSTATLVNGASTTFTLVVNTLSTTPAGTISNTANVGSGSPLDPTPGNNQATADTTIALVDLSLTKTASPGPYYVGAPVTFTLTVTNNGTVPAAGVVVTDNLPAGMSATSTTPPGACTGTTTVTCTAATLAAGASTSFTITANLPATQSITNTATVTSANGDLVPGNNAGSAQLAIVPGAAIPTLSPIFLMLLAAALAGIVLLRR
jgi:uncharacterized repeat protein (TIGR01451 family)